MNTELLDQYPWLTNYMPQGQAGSRASASSVGSPEDTVPTVGLDDDAIDRAFAELQEQRHVWAEQYHFTASHFKVCLLGGAWTQEHVGMVCDAVKAYASGQVVQGWCAR